MTPPRSVYVLTFTILTILLVVAVALAVASLHAGVLQ